MIFSSDDPCSVLLTAVLKRQCKGPNPQLGA